MNRSAATFAALAFGASVAGCLLPAGSTSRLLPKGDRLDAVESQQLFSSQRRRPPQPRHFQVDWVRSLVEPELLEWTPRELASPTTDASGRVYVATRDGMVRAFDAEGELLWEKKLKGPFVGGLAVDDTSERLYVPTADGVLWALRPRDGESLWSWKAGEELGTRPVIANGLVYVASLADTVFAIDAETGAWKWQYRRESNAEFTLRGTAAPVLDFDKLFMGFSDGTAVCLDAQDGTLKWQRAVSTARQFPDLDAQPQLDGQGHVIFASNAGPLLGLDVETGDEVWRQEARGATSMTTAGDLLIVGGEGWLTGRSLTDGHLRWKTPLPGGWAGAPVLFQKWLFVPTSQALWMVSAEDGTPLKRFNPGRGISAAPAFGRGEFFVLSNRGTLYALIPETPGKGG